MKRLSILACCLALTTHHLIHADDSSSIWRTASKFITTKGLWFIIPAIPTTVLAGWSVRNISKFFDREEIKTNMEWEITAHMARLNKVSEENNKKNLEQMAGAYNEMNQKIKLSLLDYAYTSNIMPTNIYAHHFSSVLIKKVDYDLEKKKPQPTIIQECGKILTNKSKTLRIYQQTFTALKRPANTSYGPQIKIKNKSNVESYS